MSPHRTFLCLLALGGCAANFEPATRIEKLRLLAVAADHPGASPGERVALDALVVDPKGRKLQWGFAFCTDAASTSALDCALSIDADSLVVGDQARFDFAMPDRAPSARDAAIGIAVVACPGEITPGSTFGIPIECRVDGRALELGQFELGIKRVFFASDPPNENPEIEAVHFDDAPWPAGELRTVRACERDTDDVTECPSEDRHGVSVDTPDAAESYVDSDGAAAREQAVVQFYGTGGRFELEAVTTDGTRNRWIARPEDRGELLTLYFVVRDSRGGVSWQSRQIQVE